MFNEKLEQEMLDLLDLKLIKLYDAIKDADSTAEFAKDEMYALRNRVDNLEEETKILKDIKWHELLDHLGLKWTEQNLKYFKKINNK